MLTIAWDIDDVLNNLMYEWLNWYKQSHTECIVEYKDLKENPPHNILGCTKEEYIKSLTEFRLLKYESLTPNPEVVSWFKKYGDKAYHIVVTSTRYSTEYVSSSWLFKHFYTWIRGFFVAPSYDENSKCIVYDQNKYQFLRRTRLADIIIDDNQEVIDQCRLLGIEAFLVKKPWNTSKSTLTKILHDITKFL